LDLNNIVKVAELTDAIVLQDFDSHPFSLSFRANEMQSEAGELGDVIKKLERLRMGVPGTKPEHTEESLKDKAEDEFGDVLICLGLLAKDMGLDPEQCIRRTINKLLNRYETLGMLKGMPESTRVLRAIGATPEDY
jgi:NTP pyrophosphatase (non-canonical NTP hydrolase)